MPPASSLLAFALLSFALVVVPGPSVMFVVSRAVALGRRAALLTVLGNAGGLVVQVFAVAIGLGAVLQRSTALLSTIRLAGAAYLIWLGIQAIRHRVALSEALATTGPVVGDRSVLFDGFVVGASNPKSIVFFAAILPQYVDPAGRSVGLQMGVLGLIFIAVALASDSIWGLVAGTVRQWFSGSPKRLQRFGIAGGVTMIGLGVGLAND